MSVRNAGGLNLSQVIAGLAASGQDAAPIVITPTASPFTYTNGGNYTQRVLVSGGTVVSLAIKSVANGTAYTLGLLGGQVTLSKGDALIVTYVSVPAMTAFNTTVF